MEAAERGRQEPVVLFDAVGLRYGGGPEILRDVSFSLKAGGFHFLTGPSGAGKTSLIRLVLMLLRPSRGLIRVFGRDTSGASPVEVSRLRRRMGAVFQEFRLLPHLSCFENVALPLRVVGRDPASYRQEVRELLDWVGLGSRADARPASLSGGEKQRVAIARAVIARPDLVLADEPTGNVDPSMARRLLHLFTELNRLGTSVVFATHDLSLMERYGAPRLILDDGRLWLDG